MNNAWQHAAVRAQFCTKVSAIGAREQPFTTVGGRHSSRDGQLLIDAAADEFESPTKAKAMANHRAFTPARAWWRPVDARLRRPIPAPRQPGIELVDVQTRVIHRVSPEELLVGRARGDYKALCGTRLLAASLTDPGRGRCPECAL